jgi:aldose 1-epimerase
MSIAPSGEQFEIRQGSMRAIVVEVGGGLRRLQIGDRDLLDGYGEAEMAGAGRGQVLIPWPNRIRDGRYTFRGTEYQLPLTEPAKHNASHGLVRWASWHVAERADDSVTMAHRLYPSPGYPFIPDVTVSYSLSDRGLTVSTRAVNSGDAACPFGAGFHPYLRLNAGGIDRLTLRVPASTYLVADDQQIPVGREPVAGSNLDFRNPRPIGATVLDTAFCDLERDASGRAAVELQDPDSPQAVELWMDGSYRYIMVFTGDTLAAPARRRGLAVEPMTCAPNAFASGEGLLVLEPGEVFEARWGISPVR